MLSSTVFGRFAASCVLGAAGLLACPVLAQPAGAETEVDPAEFRSPDSLEQVLALQERVAWIAEHTAPATVCLRAGGGSGSGVIVSEDGLVLTAGHVVARPGQRITFIFPDGSTARGEALGVNEGIDSGMARITDEGPWPYVEIGDLDDVERGDWVVAMGHPGGFDAERPAVARLGRMVTQRDDVVQSDCTIIGGDSGGPLFDLNGRVIGIHSRIGGGLVHNFHVPITTFTDTWDRLIAGEMWNRSMPNRPLRAGDPYIGVRPDRRGRAVIGDVVRGQAADLAGMERGDRIIAVDGKEVESFGDIVHEIRANEPGDTVTFTVVRGGEEIDLELELGRYEPDEE